MCFSKEIHELFYLINVYLLLSEYFLYSSFLLGFMGNHPLMTLSLCSKSSFIVQKDEKENTPRSVETRMLSVITEPAIPNIPRSRKIHQHFVPQ